MPENTLAAFSRAAELGADGVELDIQLSRDGEIVVIHDETIDRTSSGKGFVKDMTLAELRRFNYNKTHPECEHADIPTMKEVFELLKPTGLTINIELKTGVFDYEGIEEKIVSLTHEEGMEDRVIYSSFNHYSILKIQELDPEAKTGFLYEDGTIDMPAYAAYHHVNALHPWFYNLRYPLLMKESAERNIEVNVWTVNKAEEALMCLEKGVHAIITNHPDRIRNVIEKKELSQDYSEYVKTVIQPWLKDCVRYEDIFSYDGTRLRCVYAIHPQEKASVVIIHGFCEFFGKYHETACRLYQEGYSIFFVEMRGHGKSARSTGHGDGRIHVDSFDEYLGDMDSFITQIVKEKSKTGRLFLFGHSMGGAVSALYLEQHPDVFKCAILSSPMLKMDYGRVPDRAVGLMAVYSDVVNNDENYAPGQHAFTGIPDLANSSAMDADRYEYQFAQRIEDPDFQTWGSTWGWVKAAREAAAKAVENASLIRTPVLLLQAGEDNMVDISGQNAFRDKSEYVSLINYPGSRHELFNASDEIREEFYHDVISYYAVFQKKE